MKKLILLVPVLVMVACANFSQNAFRTLQTSQNLVFGAYVAYTNGLSTGAIHVTPDQSNAIKQARLKFAASIHTAEALRQSYETNSAVKPQAQAALDAVLSTQTEILNLINLLKQ